MRAREYRPMRGPGCAPALAAVSILWSVAARGATSAPMPIDDLTRAAVAVVVGTVESVAGVQGHDGDLFTLVGVQVEAVLKGDLGAPHVTLKEDGGQVGRWRKVIFGSPSFEVGE